MKIRFITAWKTYRVGDVIEPAAALRQLLLAARICESCDPPKPAKPHARHHTH